MCFFVCVFACLHVCVSVSVCRFFSYPFVHVYLMFMSFSYLAMWSEVAALGSSREARMPLWMWMNAIQSLHSVDLVALLQNRTAMTPESVEGIIKWIDFHPRGLVLHTYMLPKLPDAEKSALDTCKERIKEAVWGISTSLNQSTFREQGPSLLLGLKEAIDVFASSLSRMCCIPLLHRLLLAFCLSRGFHPFLVIPHTSAHRYTCTGIHCTRTHTRTHTESSLYSSKCTSIRTHEHSNTYIRTHTETHQMHTRTMPCFLLAFVVSSFDMVTGIR